jgi:hypothetical protein
MIKTKRVTKIICFVIFLLFTNQGWASDWVFYMKSGMGDEYYDKSRLKRTNKNIIRVWTKTVLNKDGREKYFQFLQSINEAPDKSSIVNYELMMNDIDCVNAKGRFSSMTINYDEDDVVYWGEKSFSKWMKITPLSTMDVLKNKVCGGRKPTPSNKK